MPVPLEPVITFDRSFIAARSFASASCSSSRRLLRFQAGTRFAAARSSAARRAAAAPNSGSWNRRSPISVAISCRLLQPRLSTTSLTADASCASSPGSNAPRNQVTPRRSARSRDGARARCTPTRDRGRLSRARRPGRRSRPGRRGRQCVAVGEVARLEVEGVQRHLSVVELSSSPPPGRRRSATTSPRVPLTMPSRQSFLRARTWSPTANV